MYFSFVLKRCLRKYKETSWGSSELRQQNWVASRVPPSPRPALPTFWKPLHSLPGFLQPRRSPAFAFKRGVSQRSKPSVRGKWRTTINRTTKQNKQDKTLFCQCISDVLSTVCASGASSLRRQTRKESVQGRTRRMRDWEELPYKGNPTDQDSTTSRRGSSEGMQQPSDCLCQTSQVTQPQQTDLQHHKETETAKRDSANC